MTADAPSKNEPGASFWLKPLSHAVAAGYGLASIGTVIFVITPQILLLYFLTRILEIPPVWAGLTLLAPKVVELVFDPLVGAVSDRTSSHLGRRWPYMVVGAVLFPLIFAGLFAPPDFSQWPITLAWVTSIYVAATIAYTVFAVPYIALVGEMTSSPPSRMRVVAWRMAFVAIGVLIAGAGAPLIVGLFADPRQGYAIAGLVLAGLCAVTVAFATTVAWRFRAPHAAISKEPIGATLRSIFRASSYRWLWISYALQMAGVSANAALLPFAVEYQLKAGEDTVSLLFLSMTLATLVAMPVAVIVGNRLGQVSGYLWSLFASGIGLFVYLWGGPSVAAPALLAATIFGFGQAGATSYPFALMPGAAENHDESAARLNAGAFAGAWTAGEKLGLALGGALAAVMLALVGFVEGQATQSAQTLASIPWIFAAAPALLFFGAMGPALPLLKTELNRRYAA